MSDYMGSTRMKMAEYTRQSRERYWRENSLSVEEVRERNNQIIENRTSQYKDSKNESQ